MSPEAKRSPQDFTRNAKLYAIFIMKMWMILVVPKTLPLDIQRRSEERFQASSERVPVP